MKVTYDQKTDTLSVVLKDNTVVAESDKEKPGVILDYDEMGNIGFVGNSRCFKASDRGT